MTPMLAYHNDPKIKTKYLDRVAAHRAADELIKGATDGRTKTGFRGCAIVCTIEEYSHAAYETELGIPHSLANIEDGIFENLPDDHAQQWPEQFLAAIPPGADLARVADHFLHWLLTDEKDGVIRFARSAKTRKAIENIGGLYAKKLRGEPVAGEEWKEARASFASFASFDSAAAAAAAAAYAAYAASFDSFDSFDSAAAAYAARYKARIRQAEKLLELLAAAPVNDN